MASGKSSLAADLAQRTGWRVASFGDYVRSQTPRELWNDRTRLQTTGATLIEELGYREFCLRALAHANIATSTVPCIVDGVRHVEILEALRSFFAPRFVGLVFVHVPETVRRKRLAIQGVRRRDIERLQRHSTEADPQAQLPVMADLTVEGDGSAVTDILAWSRQYCR